MGKGYQPLSPSPPLLNLGCNPDPNSNPNQILRKDTTMCFNVEEMGNSSFQGKATHLSLDTVGFIPLTVQSMYMTLYGHSE